MFRKLGLAACVSIAGLGVAFAENLTEKSYTCVGSNCRLYYTLGNHQAADDVKPGTKITMMFGEENEEQRLKSVRFELRDGGTKMVTFFGSAEIMIVNN
jgi:hypothetical protein